MPFRPVPDVLAGVGGDRPVLATPGAGEFIGAAADALLSRRTHSARDYAWLAVTLAGIAAAVVFWPVWCVLRRGPCAVEPEGAETEQNEGEMGEETKATFLRAQMGRVCVVHGPEWQMIGKMCRSKYGVRISTCQYMTLGFVANAH